MSRVRRLSVAVAVGVSALLLSACGPSGAGPIPTESASSPSPSESETPAAVKPALGELVLSTEGLGELKFGVAPPVDNPEVNLVAFDEDACAAEGLPGFWRATYPEVDLGLGPEPPFAVQVVGGAVTRIDVNSPEIFTDLGIHVGSSLHEVLGVYPGGPDAVVNHADVSDVYVIMGTTGKLQFEVAVDRIPDYWADSTLDTVVFLSAVDIFTEPYGIAATGNVIGVCNPG